MRGFGKRIGILGMVTLLFSALVLVMAAPTVAAPGKTPGPLADQNGQDIVRMEIRVNGTRLQSDLSQDGMFNLQYYEQSVKSPRDSASGQATGRRQYQPLLIRKRVDKSTPLLMKALTNNEVIEATFHFYRPNRNRAAGGMEEYYQVTITGGRLDSYNHSTDRDSDNDTVEEIGFVFHTITWTYTNGGVTHEDTWNAQT